MAIFEARLSSQQQDNSTAYSTITGLAITPGAGTYLAVAVVPMSSGAANFTYLALAVDGTEIAETEREHYHESSIWGSGLHVGHYTHDVITVSAGEQIQARWKSSTSVLRYAPQGSLTLISLNTGESTRVAQSSDTGSIGTTPVTVTDFGTPAADEYLVVWSGSVECGTVGGTVHVALYVGGTEVAHTERRFFCESSLTTTTTYPLMFAAVASPNGSQEMSVRAWSTGATASICHERIGVRIKDRTLLQVSGTAADTESTSGVDKALDDLTHVNPAGGNYLALGGWINNYGTIGGNCITGGKLYVETTEVTNSLTEFVWEGSLDNMDLGVFVAGEVSPDGAEDVSLQWRGSTTDTRTAYERTFVLLLDALTTSYEQEGFRWRADDGDEDAATWRQNQDVNDTVAKNQNIRLRILTDSSDADPPSAAAELQYRKVGDPATEWRKVPTP